MGIDIYTKWVDMTEQDYEDQITGFSTTDGHHGYLREAYHGGPYVTNWLVPEAFAIEDGESDQAESFFGGGVETFMNSIAAALGAESSTVGHIATKAGDGFPPSGYMVECETAAISNPRYPDEPSLCALIPSDVLEARLPLCEAIYGERCKRVYQAEPDPQGWQSFVDFVVLIKQLEAEGKRPGVYASW